MKGLPLKISSSITKDDVSVRVLIIQHLLVLMISVWLGCGPIAPSVHYFGLEIPPPTSSTNLVILRTSQPEPPFQDLGTIEISCPSKGQTGFFGSFSTEGGCYYEEAINLARPRLAAIGADGIYGVTTAAGPNGKLVSVLATAFKYGRSHVAGGSNSEAVRRQADKPSNSSP